MTPDPIPGRASLPRRQLTDPASRPDVGLPPEVLDTLDRIREHARVARRLAWTKKQNAQAPERCDRGCPNT